MQLPAKPSNVFWTQFLIWLVKKANDMLASLLSAMSNVSLGSGEFHAVYRRPLFTEFTASHQCR